jgi:hypothetical protein
LHPGWLDVVLDEVGHYGEIYATNLGHQSPLGLRQAALNNPTNSCGAQFAAPNRQKPSCRLPKSSSSASSSPWSFA